MSAASSQTASRESSAAPSSLTSPAGEPPNRTTLAVRDKGKAPELSGRRKRTVEDGEQSISSRRRTREPSPDAPPAREEDYDPDQPVDERRNIQRRLRDLQRGLQEKQDEYLKPDSTALLAYFKEANSIVADVKRTSEAAIDSRGLLLAAELAAKKTQLLVSGSVANGVDVDEFVSKCITYMLQGRGIADDDAQELSATQRQRRRSEGIGIGRGGGSDNEDGGGGHDEEIGDEGDMLNWEHLGRFACLPHVRRPGLPGFLLGPLSVEKKARRAVVRTARLKVNSLVKTQPQVLDAAELARSEKTDLTATCGKILKRLEVAQAEAQEAVIQKLEAEEQAGREVGAAQERALMEENSLRSTGGIDLMRFVVNPHSFGQTVENMFYVSFLVRDGKVKIDFDENGLPSLESMGLQDDQDGGGGGTGKQQSSMKHQAIMSLDMATWRDLIDAFNIKEPMIPHRNEDHLRQPGARGWYS